MIESKKHFAVYEKEEDHPFKQWDPRNLYVQHNYKFADDNLVEPYFTTCYNFNYKEKMAEPARVNPLRNSRKLIKSWKKL